MQCVFFEGVNSLSELEAFFKSYLWVSHLKNYLNFAVRLACFCGCNLISFLRTYHLRRPCFSPGWCLACLFIWRKKTAADLLTTFWNCFCWRLLQKWKHLSETDHSALAMYVLSFPHRGPGHKLKSCLQEIWFECQPAELVTRNTSWKNFKLLGVRLRSCRTSSKAYFMSLYALSM
jgi:hypothetical protein